MPEYVGDISIRSIARSEDVPLEVNHSLLAQAEIDALRDEVRLLRYNLCKLERERDEAREELNRITEAANAVVDRWEQPSWKDTEPTALVIYKLRSVLKEQKK